MNETTPRLIFVGRSGTGKTTFLEQLIPVLKRSGLRLSVLKHDAHGFEIDKPGKDTYRFSAAGADAVAISSPTRFAMIEQPPQELGPAEILSRLPESDLIIIEGFHLFTGTKIELHRAVLGNPLLSRPEELLAVLTDEPLPVSVPQLALDDVEGCAELILSWRSKFVQINN